MAVLQNNFGDDIAFGYPGMDADGEISNIVTRTLEGATACPFGRPVYKGTNDRGCTLTVSANLVGFALAHKGNVVTANRAADVYAPGDTLPVKNRGKIWVTAAAAVAKDDPVYVTSAGAITNATSGNTAATGWVFDDTVASGAVVRIVRR